MKTRLITILIIMLCLTILALFEALAVSSAEPVTATLQSPPDTLACFVGDTLYVLPKWIPETTPTRIPTVTPLPEKTVTPTATKNPCIATGLVKAGTLNIRQSNTTASSIVGTLKAGQTVELIQLADGWARLCDGRGWIATRLSDGTVLVQVTTK